MVDRQLNLWFKFGWSLRALGRGAVWKLGSNVVELHSIPAQDKKCCRLVPDWLPWQLAAMAHGLDDNS